MKTKSFITKPTDSPKDALQRALRFLGYRSRSEAELREYLVRGGYTTAIIDRTLEKLRSLNYLNDEVFALAWARSKAENRGFGPKRIELELRIKGIGQPRIREVIGEIFGPQEELARAKLLLAKKFSHQELKDSKAIRRAAALLQRRGYSGEVIYDLLRVPVEYD